MTMLFRHSAEVRAAWPQLVAGALYVDGVGDVPALPPSDVAARLAAHTDRAARRLARDAESEFPEVAAWRRVFAQMGLRPTQYRCASEALLRRLRKEGSLPSIHPVVDLCNAVSAAYAVPVAALDADRVTGPLLEVRPARGDEPYTTFGGAVEHPAPGEITYVDSSGRAHARRWTNRQSGHSAVGPDTRRVLVVAEAVHAEADAVVRELLRTLADAFAEQWPGGVISSARLDASWQEFEFACAADEAGGAAAAHTR
ncbi:B3/4 domain-containing protein [Streptomyces sp. Da 82-17]|uniref:B3/B4 domain-containing protein n=1 Tax=Streptomyces sp. Da 82-17 TaxID=3377116 RepID=UPI0038D38424